MSNNFVKILTVFILYILVLSTILFIVIRRYSTYVSIPDTMEMVDFSGILIVLLGASVFILTSVVLTFFLARGWVKEQPEHAKHIFRLALIINLTLIVIFGGLAGGAIILRTLWTIGFF